MPGPMGGRVIAGNVSGRENNMTEINYLLHDPICGRLLAEFAVMKCSEQSQADEIAITKEKICANIRRMRNNCGYTQRLLAIRAGMGLGRYRAIETGKREPNSSELHRIARAMGFFIEDLLRETNPPRVIWCKNIDPGCGSNC